MGMYKAWDFDIIAYIKQGRLGLTGLGKNKYDGTVEAEVQGLEEQIDQLIQYLNSQTYILIYKYGCEKDFR